MGDTEGIAGDAVEEIAFDGFGRGIGDRMNEAIKTLPVLAEFDEQIVDLRVFSNIAMKNQVAAKLCGEFRNAILEAFVLVGERQFCAFAVAGLGDTVGNGMLGKQTGNQNTFLCEESHGYSLLIFRAL